MRVLVTKLKDSTQIRLEASHGSLSASASSTQITLEPIVAIEASNATTAFNEIREWMTTLSPVPRAAINDALAVSKLVYTGSAKSSAEVAQFLYCRNYILTYGISRLNSIDHSALASKKLAFSALTGPSALKGEELNTAILHGLVDTYIATELIGSVGANIVNYTESELRASRPETFYTSAQSSCRSIPEARQYRAQ